jgi:hypothetical protein
VTAAPASANGELAARIRSFDVTINGTVSRSASS